MNELMSMNGWQDERQPWRPALSGLQGRKTRRRILLEHLQQRLDWAALWQDTAACGAAWEAKNPGFGMRCMLKVHCLQAWFGFSDIGMEEALLDVPMYRDFADVPDPFALPDSRRIRRFRAMLQAKCPGFEVPTIPQDLLDTAQGQARAQRGKPVTLATLAQPADMSAVAALPPTPRRTKDMAVCMQPLLQRPGKRRRLLTFPEAGRHPMPSAPLSRPAARDLNGMEPPKERQQVATPLALRPQRELLSRRELQTLLCIASGKRLSDIAEDLRLSPKTVSVYRARMLEKLQLSNNAQLTVYALRQGLI